MFYFLPHFAFIVKPDRLGSMDYDRFYNAVLGYAGMLENDDVLVLCQDLAQNKMRNFSL